MASHRAAPYTGRAAPKGPLSLLHAPRTRGAAQNEPHLSYLFLSCPLNARGGYWDSASMPHSNSCPRTRGAVQRGVGARYAGPLMPPHARGRLDEDDPCPQRHAHAPARLGPSAATACPSAPASTPQGGPQRYPHSRGPALFNAPGARLRGLNGVRTQKGQEPRRQGERRSSPCPRPAPGYGVRLRRGGAERKQGGRQARRGAGPDRVPSSRFPFPTGNGRPSAASAALNRLCTWFIA